MAIILGIKTINKVSILTVNTDPTTGGGTPAEIGSLALTADGSGTFEKIGATDADWQIITGGAGGITQLTGDVTAGPGSGSQVATIANNAVTNAKAADVPTATIKGRVTAATGDPEDLTSAQATTLINVFTSVLKGLAPASGGGTTNFLRADGTWAAPSSGVFSLWRNSYAKNIASTTQTSYAIVAEVIFGGTTALGTPTEIKALLEMSGATNIDIRIYDVTNALVIVEKLANVVPTATIVNLGALSNLSTGEAIWEVHLRRNGGTGSSMAIIHSFQVK